MICNFHFFALFVEDLVESHCHRLCRGGEQFHFITCKEAVTLCAVNRAVFTAVNHSHNIVISDISAVFVILGFFGSSKEKSVAVLSVTYLVDLISYPVGEFEVIGIFHILVNRHTIGICHNSYIICRFSTSLNFKACNACLSKLVDMPKRHEKPIIRLEIDEVARMLDLVESGDSLTERQKSYNEHTKLRDLTILTLFLGTGIRVSELVGLNLDDIDFSTNGFMVTRKGGNQVVLYFPDEVGEVLRRYLAVRREQNPIEGHEDALFLSLQNKRISVRAVQMMVKKYALPAAPLKKHLSPHKLRSTFGTNLYHETGDIYLVADVLGHSDVNTTRRHYAAMSDDRRRMAAKKVRLRDDPAPDSDE